MKSQILSQFQEVYLSGTWVVNTNLKAELLDTTLEEAQYKVSSLNTIEALAFHLNYYVEGVMRVLKGGSLDIRDKFSFDYTPAKSSREWEEQKEKVFANLVAFADQLAAMSAEQLESDFTNPKYGTYYRNIQVMIEHGYYHLGQIVIMKKMIREVPHIKSA